MLQRPNAIVFLGAWLDACALWRMWMPHLNFPGSRFFVFANRPNFDFITDNDIVVVQRCCTVPQFKFIETCQALGMKLVMDLDDNVFEIPKANPAYGPLKEYGDGFRACIRSVDVLTVSTKKLAQHVRNHVKPMTNMKTNKEIPIVVAENRIDERMFAVPRKSQFPIVGWAGSTSHIDDLKLIIPAIEKLAPAYPDVTFQFRGLEPPAELRCFPNVDHKYWTLVSEFGVRMPLWGWHIALAPVTDEPFNEAKSTIKMVEAAYCGIPCLASYVRCYEEFTRHDKELHWLLCASPGQWEKKLRELINDPARCEYLGTRMQAVAKRYYSFEQPHEGWTKAFELARM